MIKLLIFPSTNLMVAYLEGNYNTETECNLFFFTTFVSS